MLDAFAILYYAQDYSSIIRLKPIVNILESSPFTYVRSG